MHNLNPFENRGRTGAVLCVAALALALVACGGSRGNDEVPALREVPANATASVGAWTGFTGSLAPTESDDPLPLDGIAPPVSETDEPSAVS